MIKSPFFLDKRCCFSSFAKETYSASLVLKTLPRYVSSTSRICQYNNSFRKLIIFTKYFPELINFAKSNIRISADKTGKYPFPIQWEWKISSLDIHISVLFDLQCTVIIRLSLILMESTSGKGNCKSFNLSFFFKALCRCCNIFQLLNNLIWNIPQS